MEFKIGDYVTVKEGTVLGESKAKYNTPYEIIYVKDHFINQRKVSDMYILSADTKTTLAVNIDSIPLFYSEEIISFPLGNTELWKLIQGNI